MNVLYLDLPVLCVGRNERHEVRLSCTVPTYPILTTAVGIWEFCQLRYITMKDDSMQFIVTSASGNVKLT